MPYLHVTQSNLIRHKKYRILICRLRFPALFLPFVSNKIELVLSWNKIFFSISYPCSSLKSFVQSIFDITSSTPTNSASDLHSHRLPALTHIFIYSSQIDRMQCFHPSYLQMLLPFCDVYLDIDTLHRCGWMLHASNNIC